MTNSKDTNDLISNDGKNQANETNMSNSNQILDDDEMDFSINEDDYNDCDLESGKLINMFLKNSKKI